MRTYHYERTGAECAFCGAAFETAKHRPATCCSRDCNVAAKMLPKATLSALRAEIDRRHERAAAYLFRSQSWAEALDTSREFDCALEGTERSGFARRGGAVLSWDKSDGRDETAVIVGHFDGARLVVDVVLHGDDAREAAARPYVALDRYARPEYLADRLEFPFDLYENKGAGFKPG